MKANFCTKFVSVWMSMLPHCSSSPVTHQVDTSGCGGPLTRYLSVTSHWHPECEVCHGAIPRARAPDNITTDTPRWGCRLGLQVYKGDMPPSVPYQTSWERDPLSYLHSHLLFPHVLTAIFPCPLCLTTTLMQLFSLQSPGTPTS